MRKTQARDIKEKINKLVGQRFSYSEIADILKLKSRQLVNYHFKQYRKNLSKVGGKKKENN